MLGNMKRRWRAKHGRTEEVRRVRVVLETPVTCVMCGTVFPVQGKRAETAACCGGVCRVGLSRLEREHPGERPPHAVAL